MDVRRSAGILFILNFDAFPLLKERSEETEGKLKRK